MASGARWEWRTFGAGAEAGAPAFEGRAPSGTADSDERYLLSAGGTTVKIRDGLMDMKALLAVDADGLAAVAPVLKVAFPIEARRRFAPCGRRCGSRRPPSRATTYTAEQLEAELTGPGTGVRAVAVHKRRVRYVIDGCTAELTDVVADGRTTRTIAIETEDPARSRRRSGAGPRGLRNTAYPPGLAALLDGAAPRYAVIDAGTNSIKFHVAERDGTGFGGRSSTAPR